jgi:hypothetical protein
VQAKRRAVSFEAAAVVDGDSAGDELVQRLLGGR